jgi:hypothetical protein
MMVVAGWLLAKLQVSSRWFVILAYAKCALYHAPKSQQHHEYNTITFTSPSGAITLLAQKLPLTGLLSTCNDPIVKPSNFNKLLEMT